MLDTPTTPTCWLLLTTGPLAGDPPVVPDDTD